MRWQPRQLCGWLAVALVPHAPCSQDAYIQTISGGYRGELHLRLVPHPRASVWPQGQVPLKNFTVWHDIDYTHIYGNVLASCQAQTITWGRMAGMEQLSAICKKKVGRIQQKSKVHSMIFRKAG